MRKYQRCAFIVLPCHALPPCQCDKACLNMTRHFGLPLPLVVKVFCETTICH
jgi:hypothetical protein